MRTINEAELKLCKIQGDIFADSRSREECSSPIFMRRFMNSELAKRMDKGGFLFEACEANTVFDELNDEFGKSSYGKEKYTEHELYWIGYLYRYWCCIQGKTSKQVYKIIKPKELRELYYPYHSLDPAQAIERILEAKKLSEEDFTRRGVELFREVIKNENKKIDRKTKESANADSCFTHCELPKQ